jgi:hypothetical protein
VGELGALRQRVRPLARPGALRRGGAPAALPGLQAPPAPKVDLRVEKFYQNKHEVGTGRVRQGAALDACATAMYRRAAGTQGWTGFASSARCARGAAGAGQHKDEAVEGAALEAKAHDGALLPEDERRELCDRLAVHVVPVDLVQHVADAHLRGAARTA